VDGDEIPLVVEHRRARRAALGVGGVVDEIAAHDREAPGVEGDDPVLANHHLLGAAAGMLDDRDIFARNALAALRDQRQHAEIGDRRAVMRHRRDRDDGEIERGVGIEGLRRHEGEDPAALLDEIAVELVVEFGEAAARRFGVGQNMVVGQQQAGRDQEAGGVVRRAVAEAQRLDPADRPGRLQPAQEEIDADDVARADQALERVRVLAVDEVAAHPQPLLVLEAGGFRQHRVTLAGFRFQRRRDRRLLGAGRHGGAGELGFVVLALLFAADAGHRSPLSPQCGGARNLG
jgi:hypothetical protein